MDDVLHAFKSFDEQIFNVRPGAEAWSIAQIVDHLIRINRSYYQTFEALNSGTYQVPIHGNLGFLARAMGSMILKSVEPNRIKKMKTFAVWEPSQSNLPYSIISTFEAEQETLKNWMRRMEEGSMLNRAIASPASRVVVYPLTAAFEIIVTHEERHLQQALEVVKLIKNRAAL